MSDLSGVHKGKKRIVLHRPRPKTSEVHRLVAFDVRCVHIAS